jgi:hypothetical protein
VKARNSGANVRLAFGEADSDKMSNGFPNWRSGDIKPVRDFLLIQFCAGHQTAGDDLLSELFTEKFSPRRP